MTLVLVVAAVSWLLVLVPPVIRTRKESGSEPLIEVDRWSIITELSERRAWIPDGALRRALA